MNAPGSDWSHAFVMTPLCMSSWDCIEEETTTSLTYLIEEQLSSWKANSSTAQITYRAAGSWYWIQQSDCIFFTSRFQFRQEATSSVRTTAEEQGGGNLSDGVGFEENSLKSGKIKDCYRDRRTKLYGWTNQNELKALNHWEGAIE